ncbi:MAG: citrulline utilization hydrolase CtlX [Adhaeribacter sp.]
MQTSASILMVRPARFGFNPQTAATNAFQKHLTGLSPEEISHKAREEFDAFVDLLRDKGVKVVVASDTPEPAKPDAVFPNNWISLHPDGRVVLYPMQAASRRTERRPELLELLGQEYQVSEIVDLSGAEKQGRYLEGTGSMILDHDHRLAYACLSPRTDPKLLESFCRQFGYQPLAFHAFDHTGGAVYHTNVMLCIGTRFAVLATDTIREEEERYLVLSSLRHTGHEVIAITMDQLRHFAGNMLEVQNQEGKHFLVMSEQARLSLRPDQVQAIGQYAEILAPPLYTIEQIGGGSARCMMAEIFLPLKS